MKPPMQWQIFTVELVDSLPTKYDEVLTEHSMSFGQC